MTERQPTIQHNQKRKKKEKSPAFQFDKASP
jgi:hypothetical protein